MTDLFTRRLKEGSRIIDVKAPLTAPCDGKVLSCGPIDVYGYLDQIKGKAEYKPYMITGGWEVWGTL
jgi:phosphatidylserine decarboxylase